MLGSPWDWILTVLFAITGVICLWHLALSAEHREHAVEVRGVDALHLAMSVAMIVMIWWPPGTTGTWVQVALFAVIGAAILIGGLRATRWPVRVDSVAHVLLAVAMIWMLAAMPLIMGYDPASGAGGHAGHGAVPAASTGPAASVEISTPVAAITWTLVAVSAVCAIWWVRRLFAAPRGVLHAGCHVLMATGMALMLVEMMP